ncbi:hypothetical protein M5054_11450, partial [Neisseria meningitidis]|nr:hypothetical protein [Neisseria meningitidis]
GEATLYWFLLIHYSTEPIHLVLQHLRESFSFLFIRYIVLKHRPKPDIVRSCNIIENLSFLIS